MIAWAVAVFASDLPDVAWRARAASRSNALFWVRAGALVGLILSASASHELRVLRPFFILLLVLMLGMKLRRWLRMTARDAQIGGQPGWVRRMAASVGLGLILAAVMVAVLLVAGKERQEVFLVIGDLERWWLPGVGLALGLMVVTYFFFDYRLPSKVVITNALPLLVPALIFAGLLALNEEIMFRATLLSSLRSAVGDSQAVMLTVFVFGMAHYLGGTPANASGHGHVGNRRHLLVLVHPLHEQRANSCVLGLGRQLDNDASARLKGSPSSGFPSDGGGQLDPGPRYLPNLSSRVRLISACTRQGGKVGCLQHQPRERTGSEAPGSRPGRSGQSASDPP